MRDGSLLIKGGRLMDPARGYLGVSKDVLIRDGRFAQIADRIEAEAGIPVIELEGEYVSPGFIDIHTHVYTGVKRLCVRADEIGVATGTTTVIDAGSSGPATIEDFVERDIKTSRTRIYAAMHYATDGLMDPPEADKSEKYDLQTGIMAWEKNKDYIVAVKARASNSCVGQLGITSIKAGYDLARAIHVPMLVHIGHMPPRIEEVLNLLDKGDIITHAFHGKDNNLFLDGEIKPETQVARDRGVVFDVGHGKDSFNFNTGRLAKSKQFYPDIISTDLHSKSIHSPVISLAVTMDKFLALGYSLEDVIDKVTEKPARYLSLDYLGKIEEGAWGDVTIFTVEDRHGTFIDANGNTMEGEKSIEVRYAVVGGQVEMDSKGIIRGFCQSLGLSMLEVLRYECDMKRILVFLEKNGVIFDEERLPVFVNHILSMFNRIEKGERVTDVDEAVIDEISSKDMELAGQVIESVQKEYGDANRAEQILVAIHIHTALEESKRGEK